LVLQCGTKIQEFHPRFRENKSRNENVSDRICWAHQTPQYVRNHLLIP
jgi:hypothetical protein